MTARALTLVTLTVFLDMVGFGIVIPLLPFYVRAMGGSAEVVGLILASFSLAQMVATPILGRLSDRYGRRPVIVLSLAGNALAMVVFAAAAEWGVLWLVFASRILAGATAGNLSACQAVIADVTDGPSRAAGMGRLGIGIGLGLVVGPILGGAASRLHPAAPPLLAALLALADLVAAFFLLPETRAHASVESAGPADVPRPPLRQTLLHPRILAVMAIYFLSFLCMTNIQVSLPLLADVRLQWGADAVGRLFGLYGLMALLMQGGIGRLARRLGTPNVVLVGAIALGTGMLLLAEAGGAAGMLAGVAAMGMGVGLVNPSLASLASEHAGRGRLGVVLGFAQSAGGLARTVGPVVSGTLFDRLGPAAPFLAGSLAALTAIAVALRLRRETPSTDPAREVVTRADPEHVT